MEILKTARNYSCPVAEEHVLPCKSCKKCLSKAEIMLGTLPAPISQPFKVTSRTARTVQMCSQSEDTATNSLEAAGAMARCINCLPPSAEVVEDNLEPTPIRAGGTNISGALREPMTLPARTHGYFTWSQNKRHVNAPPMVGGPKCQNKMNGLKPNTGSQTDTKKPLEGALGSDKSVPSLNKSSRGWPTKPKFRTVIHTQMTP